MLLCIIYVIYMFLDFCVHFVELELQKVIPGEPQNIYKEISPKLCLNQEISV